jgi:hypothetical protein
MTDESQDRIRKQEFKHRIDKSYAEAADESEFLEYAKPRDIEEGVKYVQRLIYVANINTLKEFADRNYEGEKPKLIVSTPYKGKNTAEELDDVVFMPVDPKYNQVTLDNLKNLGIVPEDSQLSDYAFLFPSKQ